MNILLCVTVDYYESPLIMDYELQGYVNVHAQIINIIVSFKDFDQVMIQYKRECDSNLIKQFPFSMAKKGDTLFHFLNNMYRNIIESGWIQGSLHPDMKKADNFKPSHRMNVVKGIF